MSTLNPDKSEDRAILMEFYQLKTLAPKDYQVDTVQSDFKIDLSNEDLTQIPKELVNKLLSDNNTPKDTHEGNRRQNSKKKSFTGKPNYSDPLGYHKNILDELIDKDVLDDTRDPQLNKFVVDSKMFNPKLFLSVIHGDKSLNELVIGIKNLENDISSKKPLLQKLISDNFEKTLNSKNSLDKIFHEFSSSNLGPEIETLHGNIASSNNSANQLLNPVLMKLSKEYELTNAMSFIKKNRFFLDLPKNILAYVDCDDFDSVLNEYTKGFEHFQKLKAENNRNTLFDKIWSSVTKVINDYTESMIDELNKIHIDLISSNFRTHTNTNSKNFVTLIRRIIELNNNKNPIGSFIRFQYEYIMEDLDTGIAKIDFVALLNSWNAIANVYQICSHDSTSAIRDNLLKSTVMNLLKTMGSSSYNEEQLDSIYEKLDSHLIVHLWKMETEYVTAVADDVIDKKISRFESVVEFLINDFADLLTTQSRHNVKFEMNKNDLERIKVYFEAMINKICQRLRFVFTCSKSELLDVIEQSVGKGAVNATLPEVAGNSINDLSTFGYIPPNSNSICTLYFSSKYFDLIDTKLSQLKDSSIVSGSKNLNEIIDSTLKAINSSMIKGCLCTLTNDIMQITSIDNVSPNDSIEGASKLITFVQNYYKFFITKLHGLYRYQDIELDSIIEKELLKSFDLLVDGMIKNVSKFKGSPKSDYYFLVTIYNLRNLSQRTLPLILKSFVLNFNSKLLSDKNLKLYKDIDEHEYSLFSEYMREPVTAIKSIVNDGFRDLNLKVSRSSHQAMEVSDYLLKSINHINTLKSRLLMFKIRKSFILDVQSTLISQLQKKILDNLNVELTDESKYQVALDINVLLLLLKKFNSNVPQSNIIDIQHLEDAYSSLVANFDTDSLKKCRDTNLNFNYTQFMGFVNS
ncbi:hypothetical protein CANINC_001759 [Pichia inconspicua]|uniref:Exocyst complex component SEC5 n=1 Tax=Pichia inconspicua TaxID=52247 RepID=A0A4V4NFW1_9ASCO|nr:hypothetical protein CANINC_001759 [[Candida] inconspicua]